MICPCKGCEDRFEACHDKCEMYKMWKAEHEASKKYVHEKNMAMICTFAMKAHDRKLKRGRR